MYSGVSPIVRSHGQPVLSSILKRMLDQLRGKDAMRSAFCQILRAGLYEENEKGQVPVFGPHG